MSGKAARILLSEKQLEILQMIVKSTTASMRLIQRARIILLSFQRLRNEEIATLVGLSRKQVGLWRRRWKHSFDALVSIECREPHPTLRRTIENVLSDAPRAGAHGKFTAVQMIQIMAIACESPEQSGRPVGHRTYRELADAAQICRFRVNRINEFPDQSAVGSSPATTDYSSPAKRIGDFQGPADYWWLDTRADCFTWLRM